VAAAAGTYLLFREPESKVALTSDAGSPAVAWRF
jgi:hypothetical protein